VHVDQREQLRHAQFTLVAPLIRKSRYSLNL
jgi:hypothetical protein